MQKRPQLAPALLPVWQAWQDLHASRPWTGGAPSPLAVSEMLAWMQLNGIDDPEERRDFHALLLAMEEAWFAHWRSKQEQNPDGDLQRNR